MSTTGDDDRTGPGDDGLAATGGERITGRGRRWPRRPRAVRAVLVAALVIGTLAGSGAASAPAPVRLLLAGDSITQGSAGDFTWRYRLWQTLSRTAPGVVDLVGPRDDVFDVVHREYGSSSYADPGFAERRHGAVWGSTIDGQVGTVAEQVRAARATTLVVLLGINDLAWEQETPDDVVRDLEEFVGAARSADPDLDVVIGELLTGTVPSTGELRFAAETGAVNRGLPALADRLGTWRSQVVVADTSRGWDPQRHTWDGIHPNATGEVLIARRMAEALARLGVGGTATLPELPETTQWAVPGPRPVVTVGQDRADLTWDRATVGANAVLVEQRMVAPEGGQWTTLPAPATGDSVSVAGLVGGATYAWRLTPVKGFMVGVPGPETTAVVPGPAPGPPTGEGVVAP